MCDFRKLWLGLAALGLILLIFLCTLVHTNSIYDEQNPHHETHQHAISTDKNHGEKVPKAYDKNSPVSNITINKDAKQMTISGLFGSKETLKETEEKFALYFSSIKIEDIEIRQGIDDSIWRDIIENLAYYFSNSVEEGVLQYSKDGVKIQGFTLHKGVKEDINMVLSKYEKKHINITKNIEIVEAKTDEQKTKKALYDLLRNRKIEFENGKSTLKPEAKPLLDNIANILKTSALLHVIIEGHTDDIGNISLNESLSIERAYAVKKYLVNKGIEAKRLDTKGYGQTRPVLPNTSEINRQKNRRVEFKIKGEDNV